MGNTSLRSEGRSEGRFAEVGDRNEGQRQGYEEMIVYVYQLIYTFICHN